MRTLIFQVNGQRIRKDPTCDFNNLVSGTKGYLKAGFYFSSEWRSLRKIAIFTFPDSDEKYEVMLDRDECEIPKEVLTKRVWKVSVIGGKKGVRIVTGTTKVRQEGK